MRMNKFNYIYGPVYSWRLGRSLGVDPISGDSKVCTFNCIYCQIGSAKSIPPKRKVFVPTKDILKEIDLLDPVKIDYITFSGMGEPTLAKNLGNIIRAIRRRRKAKIAVLTNASLITKKDVQRDLKLTDFVALKLDAHSESLFKKMNKPAKDIRFTNILKGIKSFKSGYKGSLTLQVMFTSENKKHAEKIAEIAKEISPDEVHINTPLRPCGVKPISRAEIDNIKRFFKGLNISSVYDKTKKRIKSINKDDIARRRGRA